MCIYRLIWCYRCAAVNIHVFLTVGSKQAAYHEKRVHYIAMAVKHTPLTHRLEILCLPYSRYYRYACKHLILYITALGVHDVGTAFLV